MEVRQALQHVLRAGAASSQLLVSRTAPRWAPRYAPNAAAAGTSLRSISTSHTMLADRRPSRTTSPTSFTSTSSAPKAAPANASSSQPGSVSTSWPRAPKDTASPGAKPNTSPNDTSLFPDFEDPMDLAREIGRDTDDWLSKHMPKRPPPPDLRLRPSTGRTIHVQGHVDVARSLQLLGMLVRRNKLPQTVRQQRFHERPGLKRKRLRRERWRARFKDGFKATVKRVKDLTKQGW